MQWVKIKDFTNYSLSEYGDVRNDGTGRILAKPLDKDGYVKYSLCKEGKQHTLKAHRLVAKHFLDKVKGKEFVNHIDENKQNNHFSNLEWCTTKENINHGTRNERAGKAISKARSKEVAQYDLQGNFLNIFCSTVEAEKETGVYQSNISKCCNGKYKTAGGFVWKFTDEENIWKTSDNHIEKFLQNAPVKNFAGSIPVDIVKEVII